MKKFVLNNNVTYYVFKDRIGIARRNNDKDEFFGLKMLDVNDSEIMNNENLAYWIHKTASNELKIRDDTGRVVGLDTDALTKSDLWLSSLWGRIVDAKYPSMLECDEDEEKLEMDPKDMAELENYIKGRIENMTEEQKARILKNLRDSND